MTWSILGFKTSDLVSSATTIVMLDIRQNVIFIIHYIQGHKFDNCVEEYFFKILVLQTSRKEMSKIASTIL